MSLPSLELLCNEQCFRAKTNDINKFNRDLQARLKIFDKIINKNKPDKHLKHSNKVLNLNFSLTEVILTMNRSMAYLEHLDKVNNFNLSLAEIIINDNKNIDYLEYLDRVNDSNFSLAKMIFDKDKFIYYLIYLDRVNDSNFSLAERIINEEKSTSYLEYLDKVNDSNFSLAERLLDLEVPPSIFSFLVKNHPIFSIKDYYIIYKGGLKPLPFIWDNDNKALRHTKLISDGVISNLSLSIDYLVNLDYVVSFEVNADFLSNELRGSASVCEAMIHFNDTVNIDSAIGYEKSTLRKGLREIVINDKESVLLMKLFELTDENSHLTNLINVLASTKIYDVTGKVVLSLIKPGLNYYLMREDTPNTIGCVKDFFEKIKDPKTIEDVLEICDIPYEKGRNLVVGKTNKLVINNNSVKIIPYIKSNDFYKHKD